MSQRQLTAGISKWKWRRFSFGHLHRCCLDCVFIDRRSRRRDLAGSHIAALPGLASEHSLAGHEQGRIPPPRQTEPLALCITSQGPSLAAVRGGGTRPTATGTPWRPSRTTSATLASTIAALPQGNHGGGAVRGGPRAPWRAASRSRMDCRISRSFEDMAGRYSDLSFQAIQAARWGVAATPTGSEPAPAQESSLASALQRELPVDGCA